MSLDHDDLLMERLSPAQSAEPALTPEEKKLHTVVDEKQQLMVEQSRAFLESLFAENSTIPVRTKNVQVTNSQHLRNSFLAAQLRPLLERDLVTLAQFLKSTDEVYRNLAKHDILEQCQVSLHQLPKQPWSRAPPRTLDLVPVFNIVPQKKFYAKTGTNIGNGEGDGYIQFQLKNLFGGAENVVFDAVTGTKTPSSYVFNYSQPINNYSRFLWDSLVYVNTRNLDWIQSSVDTKGTTHKISSRLDSKLNFDLSFENAWRRLSNHGSRSMEVIRQLKDTFKSSVLFNIKYDTRDHPITPTIGSFARVGIEKCGLFRLNNVSFTKLVWEGQMACKLSETQTLIASNKAGALFGTANRTSNVLDRFHMGGPNDVRSFLLQGLGPKENNSSVGGDYFLSGGLSLLSHIPRTPKDSNFKFHTFVNSGKLVKGGDTFPNVVKKLTKEHSISIGTGILYNHPLARFELNFVLPITAHSTDYLRKGIQYGVGISFL
ncbi:hypothetical protein METBIDRAFT_79643 [Metschnikowia bicuspidata var. bicuspidata NRRL YB-4993]|uniref:Bacterial surface antigen (D15) domain-containing protein n=1 Tax=Metschnikowia bicuspidata var. bicuspidata NRRL YB-4993 TaxID=869754 RepID=A0A1A0H6C9_9ASCO|nr:hypothetical protein METBIDRAFT_79643 [Metschnikowia bicuspidata var. bicuspidata NRRL YB-4993]OBA19644.1 hypothetical protein METBIDRAFT_79643 [Metschnikowia bicuspidata var. bicuspidata NRRL YB-4993]